ncbi:MAG: AlpA family transcriptional regulator [Mesorhizobium sp.]|nr:MAG: AlpA family transcriptional regulator [Mesorhizobium sp.]
MTQNIIRMQEVKKATGLSKATLYRRIARNEFPKPVPLGVNSVGWLSEEVAAWQKARIAARDGGLAA